jgi:hypothetical protein
LFSAWRISGGHRAGVRRQCQFVAQVDHPLTQLGEARLDTGCVVERDAPRRVIDFPRESTKSAIGAQMNIGV